MGFNRLDYTLKHNIMHNICTSSFPLETWFALVKQPQQWMAPPLVLSKSCTQCPSRTNSHNSQKGLGVHHRPPTMLSLPVQHPNKSHKDAVIPVYRWTSWELKEGITCEGCIPRKVLNRIWTWIFVYWAHNIHNMFTLSWPYMLKRKLHATSPTSHLLSKNFH